MGLHGSRRRGAAAAASAWLAALCASCVVVVGAAVGAAAETRVAFGSCAKAHKVPEAPLWRAAAAFAPECWVWLGDAVYADLPAGLPVGPLRRSRFGGVERTRDLYARQRRDPGYDALLRGGAEVLGTWDDHDFGVNDGGEADQPDALAARGLFLDFIGEPADSARRSRAGGLYAAHAFGEPGRKVLVVLLDTRSRRGPHASDGDVLGEEQWAWLERTLAESDAQLHLVASSIQVLDDPGAYLPPTSVLRFLTGRTLEGWGSWPRARARLLRLLGSVPGVVLLSGDVHHGVITEVAPGCALPYTAVDVTSSGITHTFVDKAPSHMRRALFPKGTVVPWLFPKAFRRTRLVERNFGTVTVDWDAGTVLLEVRNETGVPRLSRELRLDELRPDAPGAETLRKCPTERDLPFPARAHLLLSVGSEYLAPAGALVALIGVLLLVRYAASAVRALWAMEPGTHSKTE